MLLLVGGIFRRGALAIAGDGDSEDEARGWA